MCDTMHLLEQNLLKVEGLLRRLYKLFDEPNWGGGGEKNMKKATLIKQMWMKRNELWFLSL